MREYDFFMLKISGKRYMLSIGILVWNLLIRGKNLFNILLVFFIRCIIFVFVCICIWYLWNSKDFSIFLLILGFDNLSFECDKINFLMSLGNKILGLLFIRLKLIDVMIDRNFVCDSFMFVELLNFFLVFK